MSLPYIITIAQCSAQLGLMFSAAAVAAVLHCVPQRARNLDGFHVASFMVGRHIIGYKLASSLLDKSAFSRDQETRRFGSRNLDVQCNQQAQVYHVAMLTRAENLSPEHLLVQLPVYHDLC